MKPLLSIDQIPGAGKHQVGGKAWCLAKMYTRGIYIPETFCIPCQVYEDYLAETRLKDSILLELHRKPLKKMRWEEIWDISLRIRNLFLTTPIPQTIQTELSDLLSQHRGGIHWAIRSSAPGEDNESTSFAGLHQSYLNITGTREILKHIKLVWASLYSDAAILYRKELGLDIHTSKMAVLIQKLVFSDRSGIFFGINPSNAAESVIESVYGLNQGLVDGDVEPDRWLMKRSTGKILSHHAPVRDLCAIPDSQGVRFETLSEKSKHTPPLNDFELMNIWETGIRLETIFGRPQDMEWTFRNDQLIILQSRPITTSSFKETDDKRVWYLSLHRSYENLKHLYDKIEHHLIPEMIREARILGEISLHKLDSRKLCSEIKKRQAIYDHWVKVYWSDFIPFAHGIRLFGQIYNDAVKPQDPYEFMVLLENTALKSMRRNRLLESMADMIRKDDSLRAVLESEYDLDSSQVFTSMLNAFINEFGDLSCSTGSGNDCQYGTTGIVRLLLEFARTPLKNKIPGTHDTKILQQAYLNCFPIEKKDFAEELLYLGRESYRLRDDDNIHLGRIEARLLEAIQDGQRRLTDANTSPEDCAVLSKLPTLSALEGPAPTQNETPLTDQVSKKWIAARQIIGHPAGPGIARGKARLIKHPQDLLEFKADEILICQGVDPNMTFVIPLASAVVEERGGMLIHGAIIAREYGLPCITGASDIMKLIETGDRITVDGYLGIITAETRDISNS